MSTRIILTSALCIIAAILAAAFFIIQPSENNSANKEANSARALETNTTTEGDVYANDGTRLHYWFFDRGTNRVLVYLHGGPSSNSSAVRNAFGERFADTFGSILFFDQRGTGESQRDVNSETLRFSTAVEDVHTLIQQILPNRQVVLFGHSFGGTIAVQYMQRYQHEVTALILSAPWLNEAICEEARLTMPESAYDLNVRENALAEPYMTSQKQSTVADAWYANEQLNESNYLPLLSVITVPTVVISGEQDINVPPAQVEAMKEYLPDATTVRIVEAGHKALFSQTEAVFRSLATFLK